MGTHERSMVACPLTDEQMVALTLRPNAAPSSPSFSRLACPAQPFCIPRYMLSISMDYLVARSARHQACGSFNSRMYLFADHQFSFAPGAFAAEH
jgi:hypothetical protein